MCPWRTRGRLEVQYPHVPLKVGSWKYLVNSGSDKLKRPRNLHQESQLLVKSISGSFSQHQGTAVNCGEIKTGTTWFQPPTSSLTKDTSLYQFPYQNQFSQTLLGITGYWCFVGNKGGRNVFGALRVFLSSPSLLLCLLPYPFGCGLCLLQSYWMNTARLLVSWSEQAWAFRERRCEAEGKASFHPGGPAASCQMCLNTRGGHFGCSQWPGALVAFGKCLLGMLMVLPCPGRSWPVEDSAVPDTSIWESRERQLSAPSVEVLWSAPALSCREAYSQAARLRMGFRLS